MESFAAFFDRSTPLLRTAANLPHWKQEGATYFVTFRLVDSLPQQELLQWITERTQWLEAHQEPLTKEDRCEYHLRFSTRMEVWLDQGSGSNVLALDACRRIVADALRCFDGQRYRLGEFVIASNHVHLLVKPHPGFDLSGLLHSWKSFTSKRICEIEAACRCLMPWWKRLHERRLAHPRTTPPRPSQPAFERPVWQKESFDHIVRSPAAMQRFERYIRAHKRYLPLGGSGVPPLVPKGR